MAADTSAERRTVRVHFVRMAADTSAKRGRTGVVGFRTVVLRLRVSSDGRRFDVPRQPSIVFLEDRQSSMVAREDPQVLL